MKRIAKALAIAGIGLCLAAPANAQTWLLGSSNGERLVTGDYFPVSGQGRWNTYNKAIKYFAPADGTVIAMVCGANSAPKDTNGFWAFQLEIFTPDFNLIQGANCDITPESNPCVVQMNVPIAQGDALLFVMPQAEGQTQAEVVASPVSCSLKVVP